MDLTLWGFTCRLMHLLTLTLHCKMHLSALPLLAVDGISLTNHTAYQFLRQVLHQGQMPSHKPSREWQKQQMWVKCSCLCTHLG
jgi:hypothetical protein